MPGLKFDKKVAIVTGGGGRHPSLGRSHALFLASRGARVVVNDVGTGPDGRGEISASAAALVEEIRAAGGEAVADTNSVADPDGAEAIVKTALDAFGAIDILINNAGVAHLAPFGELSNGDIRRMVDVHLMGTIWMCRAVWPHMAAQRYGRIVNVGSAAMFGTRGSVVYAGAKAGVFSLARGLAVEGREYDIKVNTLLPRAGTLAITHLQADSERTRKIMQLAPEQVAPVVALLAHEQCPCSGKGIEAGGGRVWEVLLAKTRGYRSEMIDLDDLATHWPKVVDRDGLAILPDGFAESPMTLKPYIPR